MPTLTIPAPRLREHGIRTTPDLLRVYNVQLRERGFRLKQDGLPHRRVWIADPPLVVEQDDDRNLLIAQTVTDRLLNNNPRIYPLLQSITREDSAAIQPLLSLLFSEGDDRAETIQSFEVSVPEQCIFAADTGTQSDGHNTGILTGEQYANRVLCRKIAVLFGLVQDRL